MGAPIFIFSEGEKKRFVIINISDDERLRESEQPSFIPGSTDDALEEEKMKSKPVAGNNEGLPLSFSSLLLACIWK